MTGGKSDPYYEVRRAFGEGYKSPTLNPQYMGEHDSADAPFYKSEYIKNELNPTWKAHVLDLRRCPRFLLPRVG